MQWFALIDLQRVNMSTSDYHDLFILQTEWDNLKPYGHHLWIDAQKSKTIWKKIKYKSNFMETECNLNISVVVPLKRYKR